MIFWASTLPNSTPHWSKESMFQIAPCVNTECSYRATSLPNVAGVSRSARIVFDGRLPSKTRCGTSLSGVPSASTCSRVLPDASASVCAKTLASSRSEEAHFHSSVPDGHYRTSGTAHHLVRSGPGSVRGRGRIYEPTRTHNYEVNFQLCGCLQYFLTYRTSRAELYDKFRFDFQPDAQSQFLKLLEGGRAEETIWRPTGADNVERDELSRHMIGKGNGMWQRAQRSLIEICRKQVCRVRMDVVNSRFLIRARPDSQIRAIGAVENLFCD